MTDFTIMPYTKIDGIPTFKDSQLIGMYDRIVDEEKGYVFSDGTINDGNAFVEMAKRPDTSFYAVYQGETIVLVVWLNRFEGAMARMNWCSFKSVSFETKLEAGRYVIKTLTDKVVDLLVGYTPASNKGAIKAAELCGGKILGTVPNLVWNEQEQKSKEGVIIYYEKGSGHEDIQ